MKSFLLDYAESFNIFFPIEKLKKQLGCRNGFTLLEMLIVLCLISILTALAFPNLLEWNRNNKLKGDARKLYSTMQKAKMMAIKNNSNAIISFNATANSYIAFIDNGGTTGTPLDKTLNGDEEIIGSETTDKSVVIQGVNFSFGNTTPGFTARGLPVSNIIGNVVLRSATGTTLWYKITLSFAGGLSLTKCSDSTDGINGTWN